MVKNNSKRTRKGTVGKKDNVSKKNKLTSKQKQIRKQVLKGGDPLKIIEFKNQPGLLTLPSTTHPYGYYTTFDNETKLKNRSFSKKSDIFSFGCLIIDLFSYPFYDKEVVETNHKKLAYTNDDNKKEGNELKASRQDYETYVDSLLINNDLKNNRGTFKDIIKKLVTLILGHSVINFDNDEFGFDEIIHLLERIKKLPTIDEKIEDTGGYEEIYAGYKIDNIDYETETIIQTYLENELTKLFNDPELKILEAALKDEQPIESIKGELRAFFKSEEFKTTEGKDLHHLNFENLDICINNLLDAITRIIPKHNNLDVDQIYEIKTELKSFLNEVYEKQINNYEKINNTTLLEVTEIKNITYSVILTPNQKKELLDTLSPFDPFITLSFAIKGGALLFSKLQPHLNEMSEKKKPISGNFGTTFFGKFKKKPVIKKARFLFGKSKTQDSQNEPQEFELAFKTVETSNDEISATIRRKLRGTNELTSLEEYNKAIESILDFYNESLIASIIQSSPSNKFPKYYGFSIKPIKITKGSESNISTDNQNPKLLMEYLKGDNLGNVKRDRRRTNNLNNSDLINYLIKIAQAIKDLHTLGILHLDLAERNIMIVTEKEGDKVNDKIKIIDFGKSKILPNVILPDEQSTVKDIIEDLYKDSKNIFLKKTELNEKIPLFYSNLEIEPITSTNSGGSRNNSTKKSKKTKKTKKAKKRVKHSSTKKTHKKKV